MGITPAKTNPPSIDNPFPLTLNAPPSSPQNINHCAFFCIRGVGIYYYGQPLCYAPTSVGMKIWGHIFNGPASILDTPKDKAVYVIPSLNSGVGGRRSWQDAEK